MFYQHTKTDLYKEREKTMSPLQHVHLKDENSPQKAFYDLWIQKISDGYLVCKASGANGKVLNKESWFRETKQEAEEKFQRILSNKLNPNRKSPRKYQMIPSSLTA